MNIVKNVKQIKNIFFKLNYTINMNIFNSIMFMNKK